MSLLHLSHVDLGTLSLKGEALHASKAGKSSEQPPSHRSLDARDTIYVSLEDNMIAKGRIGRVYRGTMTLCSSSCSQTRVVVKLVMPQGRVNGKKLYYKGFDGYNILTDLAKEAEVYASLHPIQGDVVPLCYGYYRNDVAGCLVLQDCGEDLKFPYRRLELHERRRLFELQRKLHEAGMSHGDVARRNFVKGPGGIRLLDFDKAVRHQCAGFLEPTSGCDFPGQDQEECTELRKLFKAFGLFPMKCYSPRERKAYGLWDGEPWCECWITRSEFLFSSSSAHSSDEPDQES